MSVALRPGEARRPRLSRCHVFGSTQASSDVNVAVMMPLPFGLATLDLHIYCIRHYIIVLKCADVNRKVDLV